MSRCCVVLSLLSLLWLVACRAPVPVADDALAAFLPGARDGALQAASGSAPVGPAGDAPLASAIDPFRPLMLLRLPAPAGLVGDGLESFAGRDADVRDVLAVLFAGGGLDYVVAGDVHGDISFDFRTTTRAEAFLELLRHAGLSMSVAEGRVVLSGRERRRFDVSDLGTSADELVLGLSSLLDVHGYGVRLPDGRLEVETTATAMEHVVAWLDGQWPAETGGLPFRLAVEPADERADQQAQGVSQGRLGRRELAEALSRRGLTDVLAGRPIAALRRLDDALALEPELSLAHLARGLARLLAGDLVAAQAALDRAVAARPDDRLAQTLAALDDLAAGRASLAVSGLEAVDRRWHDPRSASNLAGALQLAGRPDEALAAARTDEGSPPPALHLLRAWLFARAEWVEAARAEVETARGLGLAADDEGCALVLSVLDALQRGHSPFGALSLAAPGSEPSGAQAVPSAPSSAGVRERFDSSWH